MNVERFSFRDFGDGLPVGAPRTGKPFMPSGKAREDAPPPPQTFSEEQLKIAERTGYQKGFLEGEKEGRKQAESEQAEIDRKLSESVEKFAHSLQPLFDDYRKTALAVQEQMPKAALAIARKVAGHALAQNAQAVIDELAVAACETMIKEPKLTITVHESLGDALTKKLEKLAERLQSASDIVILRDPNLPPADCRIEWNHGGMERNTEQLWRKVEKVIEDISLNPVGRDSGSTGPDTGSNFDPAQSPGDSQNLSAGPDEQSKT